MFVSFLIIIDIVFRLDKEKNKSQYLTWHWIDVLTIIPFAYLAISIFPNYSLLVIILLLVRIFTLFKYLSKLRKIRNLARKTKLDYATFVLLITFIFGSVLFFLVESPVNPTASTLDSSVFFIIISMTTVGYGNTVPFTHTGQLIAVIAIIVGIGYTGWVTAAIASSLVDEFIRESDKQIEKQNKSKEIILEKLDKIEKELEEMRK